MDWLIREQPKVIYPVSAPHHGPSAAPRAGAVVDAQQAISHGNGRVDP
jgi:hypothetical protein